MIINVRNFITMILLLPIAACKQQSNKQTVKIIHNDSAINKKDFTHIHFASTLDLGCYMPIRAGVEDTAIINGKVYGFCSKECKEEFEKDPLGNIKAGERRTKK